MPKLLRLDKKEGGNLVSLALVFRFSCSHNITVPGPVGVQGS